MGRLQRIRNLIASRLREAAGRRRPRAHSASDAAAEPEPESRRDEPAAPDPRGRALRILELGCDAGATEIRSAYRRLCRRYHPDRFANDADKSASANELLAEINRAYEVLTGAP